VLTSLLFAALHVQYSWYGMLSILAFGLLLGVIRHRSSTTAAILVHTLHNLLAVASAKP
jgi:membrane protease YdiL (CAAX protease family)